MAQSFQIAIVSDVHYASAAEQARGDDYETRDLGPLTRFLLKRFRHYIWMRDPLRQGHLLDKFLEQAGAPDLVVANGDYCVDTAFVGVSDAAAAQSAGECLAKLRARFGDKLRACVGDHELGKMSLIGRRGGLRLASWRTATGQLGLPAFWQHEVGNHVLAGVASPLLAFPVYEPESLPEERKGWQELRERHLAEIRAFFSGLRPEQRVILFCHDPTALPFLAREGVVGSTFSQIELTVIGHLHSNLILWNSRMLAGMPKIRFLGHTALRLSSAVSEARWWRPFRVRLCPSLAGLQLLRDGGWVKLELDPSGAQKLRFFAQKLH